MSAAFTPGPWIVATSNSWRRIVSEGRGGMQSVCEPIKQNDGHPDLYFRNGGADGPDALLIASAPSLLDELKALELSANTVAYCYDKRPENFAVALRDLIESAQHARAAIAKATGEGA